MRKRFFTATFILLLLYFGSYLLLGKKFLANQIKRDNHSTYDDFQWTSKINLISNIYFGNSSIQILKQIVKSEQASIRFIRTKNENDLKRFAHNKSTYNYLLLADSPHLPWIKIEEIENFQEYVAAWDIEYIWCFFIWIKIRDEMSMIS